MSGDNTFKISSNDNIIATIELNGSYRTMSGGIATVTKKFGKFWMVNYTGTHHLRINAGYMTEKGLRVTEAGLDLIDPETGGRDFRDDLVTNNTICKRARPYMTRNSGRNER